MDIAEVVLGTLTLLTSIVGIFLVVHQLAQTGQIHAADSLRQKRQATLEAYHAVRVDMRVRKDAIKKACGIDLDKKRLDDADVKRIMTSAAEAEHVNTVLDYLHQFATGIEFGMYDREVLSKLSGVQFIKTYERLRPYVHALRDSVSPTIYVNLEAFVEALKGDTGYKQYDPPPAEDKLGNAAANQAPSTE